jgi:hypothetical protein
VCFVKEEKRKKRETNDRRGKNEYALSQGKMEY